MLSDTTTIARPYAKAVFEAAVASSKLAKWSEMLQLMATVALDKKTVDFLTSPQINTDEQVEFMLAVCGKLLDEQGQNLIRTLAHNKRLLALSDICALFELSRADYEKTLEVNVTSFSALSAAQQKSLIESLSQRFDRKVSLNVEIDGSLLGGAIIRAGDMVIDGSVRGKLNKLHTELAA